MWPGRHGEIIGLLLLLALVDGGGASSTGTPGPSAVPASDPTDMATSLATTQPRPWVRIPAISSQPALTPTRTPVPARLVAWRYWPNVADLRQVAVDGDALWIAAVSGLVRYEPAVDRWRVWTTADGLVDNTCLSVTVWRDEVWVGTQGGVSRFSPASNSWRSYGLADGLAGLHNTLLYLDPYTQVLWAGTLEGLSFYDRQADRWETVQAQGRDLPVVTSIWASPDALWVSQPTSSEPVPGIWQLDKATRMWHSVAQTMSIPPSDQYALAGDQSHLWALGMQGTPYGLDRATGKWRVLDDTTATLKSHLQWLADQAPGVWMWDSQRWLVYDTTGGQITYLRPSAECSDPLGAPAFAADTAWIPTHGGLCSVNLVSLEWSYHERTGLPAQTEWVYGAPGYGLLVYSIGRLGLLDPVSGSWQTLPAIPGSTALGVPEVAQQPENGDLWMALTSSTPNTASLQSRQIWHYIASDSSSEYTLDPAAVPAMPGAQHLLPMVDQGRLWFLGTDALFAYAVKEGKWQRYPLGNPAEYVSFGAQDRGAIWLLSGGRTLIRFDLHRLTTTLYPIPFGGGWSLVSTSTQKVWLAGDSNRLLSLIPETEQWFDVTLDSNCTGPWIVTLTAGGDAIWASGERGAIRYQQETGEQQCFQRGNGMLDNRASQITIQGNWVWFWHPWRGIWGWGSKAEGEP